MGCSAIFCICEHLKNCFLQLFENIEKLGIEYEYPERTDDGTNDATDGQRTETDDGVGQRD